MNASALTPVAGGVGCVLLVAVVIGAVAAYNRLVRLRDQADAAWARIDVQLKRRHDLIPHLVECVRGHVAHERGTLDAVVAARGDAMNLARGAGPAARAEAEGALTRALSRLVATAGAYPGLQADQNFAVLRAELVTTEDRIAYAGQLSTSAVQSYNRVVRSLPTNLVAGLAGFRSREYFQVASDERGPAPVRF